MWPQHLHINRPLLLENRAGVGGFVIECDVRADGFHELDLFLGTGGSDDLQAGFLRELDNEPVSLKSTYTKESRRQDTHAPTPPRMLGENRQFRAKIEYLPAPAVTNATSPYPIMNMVLKTRI